MRTAVELPNIKHVALVLQNRGFIVVNIQVVRGGEDCHDGGEASGPGLAVHAVAEDC